MILIFDFSLILLRMWGSHYPNLNKKQKLQMYNDIEIFRIPHPVISSVVKLGIVAKRGACSRINDSSGLPERRKSSLFK
jgi:hypothetical protein